MVVYTSFPYRIVTQVSFEDVSPRYVVQKYSRNYGAYRTIPHPLGKVMRTFQHAKNFLRYRIRTSDSRPAPRACCGGCCCGR